MIQLENFGVKYLQLPAWREQRRIFHAFSSRWGGVSSSPFDNLNVSFNVGDEKTFVAENRRRLFMALGLDSQPVVKVRQVHGDQVLPVTLEMTLQAGFPAGLMEAPYDALVTDLKGVALSISTADCLPLLFYDTRLAVIGAAHAGWRGVAQGIAAKTLDKMEMTYGCDVEDTTVAIGPGIGPCCYRVDEPVVKAIFNNKTSRGEVIPPMARPLPESADLSDSSFLIPEDPDSDGKVTQWRLDMEAVVKSQLIKAGVRWENIHTSGLCTSCHADLFFSHRRDQGRSGRMLALIMMK